jgi:hypothetical protein
VKCGEKDEHRLLNEKTEGELSQDALVRRVLMMSTLINLI